MRTRSHTKIKRKVDNREPSILNDLQILFMKKGSIHLMTFKKIKNRGLSLYYDTGFQIGFISPYGTREIT